MIEIVLHPPHAHSFNAQDTHNVSHVLMQMRIPLPILITPRVALCQPLYPISNANLKDLTPEHLDTFMKPTHCLMSILNLLFLEF